MEIVFIGIIILIAPEQYHCSLQGCTITDIVPAKLVIVLAAQRCELDTCVFDCNFLVVDLCTFSALCTGSSSDYNIT